MNLVAKALWYIESHFAEEISLDAIAGAANVSRFHMARAFGLATGLPVMRYVRGRRLTEAARVLVRGAPDILTVALDAGYGSHEAFTRAFRDQFGVTPEAVRNRGCLANLQLVEPMKMVETGTVELQEPRRNSAGPLLIAGLRERYSIETIAGIPMQWQRFGPLIGLIPGRIGREAYGVCCDFDEAGHFDYLSGVAVSGTSGLPAELSTVSIPAREYLVFHHRGHISGIHGTWRAIMEEWLPASGLRPADTPNFERYAADFDANTGLGGVEIWIPTGVTATSRDVGFSRERDTANCLPGPESHGTYGAMIQLMRLALLTALLAGCAAYAPPAEDAPCCGPPAPGTVRVHTGGQFNAGVGTGWR